MKRIMNEENDWDHGQRDAVGDAVDCVHRDEVVQALNKIKTGTAPEPSDVPLELIATSRKT